MYQFWEATLPHHCRIVLHAVMRIRGAAVMSTALPPSTLMVVALLPAALARLHGTFALFPAALVLAVVIPLVGLLVVPNVRLPIYLTTVALLPAVLARLRGTFAPFPDVLVLASLVPLLGLIGGLTRSAAGLSMISNTRVCKIRRAGLGLLSKS